jgi:hypothetical protein
MSKRRRQQIEGQLGFAFDPPAAAAAPASLAHIERLICEGVSTILHGDDRRREVIAAEMSVLLGEDVSKSMLDAYASPAREGHKVPMARFLALIAVCDRHDVLDLVVRPIGAAVLVGEEVHTARLGHLRRQLAHIKTELVALEKQAPLIGGNRGS